MRVLACALAVPLSLLHAQGTTQLQAPKRDPLPAVLRPACAVGGSAAPAPAEALRRQARDAAASAQQAAILGDTATALSKLRTARRLDPTDADIAYQLARVYESAGANDSATTEYCRFLTLGPNPADAADARARLTVIATPTTDPQVDSANASFRAGLAAYDAGRMVDAEAQFARAVQLRTGWADAYFDRALARLAQGDRDGAASDLELYLRIDGAASDRDAVSAQIEALRHTRLSAGQAFAMGVVVPGAGQFYTHRPLRGTLYLAAAGGAVAYAMTTQQSATTVQRTATDPFGNSYSYPVTQTETKRPHLVPGIAVAAGIGIASAVEAALYARTANGGPAPRVSFVASPGHYAVAARLPF